MEYLCYVIGFCSLVRILTKKKLKIKVVLLMYQKCMIPKMPFLSFYIFHGSSKPIPMKLQSWSLLGAEVFGLHGLGKFTSFGRSLGGWNWAELGGTNREYPTGDWNRKNMVIHFDG